jgi:hypothetical protein
VLSMVARSNMAGSGAPTTVVLALTCASSTKHCLHAKLGGLFSIQTLCAQLFKA